MRPSSQPTGRPTAQPTVQPTGQPSSVPTFPTPYPSFAPGNPVFRGYVVKIREPRYSPRIINLNEIELYLNNERVLVSNRTCNTTISTAMPGAPLHRCFDGDVEASFCSTGGEGGIRAKITVDTKQRPFDRIVVYNRRDCCQDYILGATIDVENYLHEVVYSAVFDAVREEYTFYSPVDVYEEPARNISVLLHACMALLWLGLAAAYLVHQQLRRQHIISADAAHRRAAEQAYYAEEHSGLPSEERACQLVASYALGLLPAACEDDSLWRRLRTEFARSHKFFAAVWPAAAALAGTGDGEDHAASGAAVWACAKCCTHSCMLFFYVAVLYSTYAPADDSSCTKMSNSTEGACLARALPLSMAPLVSAKSYCSWRPAVVNETFFGSQCSYNAQVFDENSTIIMGLLVGVLATVTGLLLEQLFAFAARPALPRPPRRVLPSDGAAEAAAAKAAETDMRERTSRRVVALQFVAKIAVKRFQRGIARRTALQALSQTKTKQFIYEESKAGDAAGVSEARGAEAAPAGRQRLRLWTQPRKAVPAGTSGDRDFDSMCEDMYYQVCPLIATEPLARTT